MITSDLRGRLDALLAAFDAAFVEREEQARLTLLALLAGQHVLLLGPPGTAKSLLARAACAGFADASYFEYLLTRFTHPDELFGPVSIPGLKDEDFRRVTAGFLPAAEIAFIDEIFKANSAILNSLLSLVNERVFHHGRHRDAAPLIGLIGASNEPPDPEGGLGALYDRFLVRLEVPPTHDPDAFLAVCLGALAPFEPAPAARLTLADLAAVRAAAAAVAVPEPVQAQLVAIRDALREAAIPASDRRWRQALELLRVAAATSGRAAVGAPEVLLLQHCFGDPTDSTSTVRAIVRRALEALVRPPAATAVAAAWAALGDGPAAGSPPPAAAVHSAHELERAVADRLGALDRFEAELAGATHALDAHRDALVAEAEASPCVVGVPARLMAGFITARRDLARYTDALARYRARLATIDLYSEVLPRARKAQASSVGHAERARHDRRLPPLWLSRPGEAPDAWIPVSAEGLLLEDQRALIAGAIHRDLIDRTMAAGLPVTHAVRWDQAVVHLALDNALLFRLLQHADPDRPLELPALAAAPEAEAALRALLAWLRGVGLRHLPPPPPLDGPHG